MKHTFKAEDLVVRNTQKEPWESRKKQFIPGVVGGVGGSGAALMHVERVYRIAGFLPNGGVVLHGFSLAVGAKELELASPEQITQDNRNPVSASAPCKDLWCGCRTALGST